MLPLHAGQLCFYSIDYTAFERRYLIEIQILICVLYTKLKLRIFAITEIQDECSSVWILWLLLHFNGELRNFFLPCPIIRASDSDAIDEINVATN